MFAYLKNSSLNVTQKRQSIRYMNTHEFSSFNFLPFFLIRFFVFNFRSYGTKITRANKASTRNLKDPRRKQDFLIVRLRRRSVKDVLRGRRIFRKTTYETDIKAKYTDTVRSSTTLTAVMVGVRLCTTRTQTHDNQKIKTQSDYTVKRQTREYSMIPFLFLPHFRLNGI